jgi:hypothetical protein
MKKFAIGCLAVIGAITIVSMGIAIISSIPDSSENGGTTTATKTLTETTMVAPLTTTTEPPTQTTPVITETPTTSTPDVTETTQPTIEIILLEAQIDGLLDISACGTGSLDKVKLSFTSNSDSNLQVLIIPGMIFESRSADIQGMVVTTEKTILLEPYEAGKTVYVDTGGINMQLDVPDDVNALALSITTASGDLMKLLDLSNLHEETLRIQQFAIWTITDNPARDDYVGIGSFGVGSGPDDNEIEKIRFLFEEAGIDTAKYWALQTAVYVELIEAKISGLVTVNACGIGSLERIKLSITSQSDNTLQIAILPGMIFESRSAGIQSMVVISKKLILLDPFETLESIKIDAACYNMELDMPGESDALILSMSPAGGDLMKLFNLPDFYEASYRVQQFAIWTITDNPGRGGYVGIGFFGMGTGPSDGEIEKIRTLFIDAGIETDKYKALS